MDQLENHGKILTSVFQTIYNLRLIRIKMIHKLKTMRKRNAKITAKHDFIMQHFGDFDTVHPDQHISSLITT